MHDESDYPVTGILTETRIPKARGQKRIPGVASTPTVKPSTIFTGDNLPILRGMETESVDLIYLDPPFNSKRNYSAPVGSDAAGAAFRDTWSLSDTDISWWGLIADEHPMLYKVIDAAGVGGKGDMSYCIYMAVRLLEMHRLLKPTGSIYYHCDPAMSHAIKLVMDAVFGASNFRNEVVWHYPNRLSQKGFPFPKMHDTLLCFSKTDNFVKTELADETWQPSKAQERRVEKGWEYYKGNLVVYDEEKAKNDGHDLSKGNWTAGKTGRKRVNSVWMMNMIASTAKERIGYPTQKPTALLKRIIAASSNEGDMVLDPFCGCATACVAAQELRRKWIGIDISKKAYELVIMRFKDQLGIFKPGIIHRTDQPVRTGAQARSKNIKHILFGEQQGRCNGCKSDFQFRHFEVDHIVPLADGGADTDSNLQLLCGSCNRIKGKRSMAHLDARLREMGIIT